MPAKVAVFMGTRPEAIKLAPVVAELERCPSLEPLIINSGQHVELIQPVIDLFGIKVIANLESMRPGQTLSQLTARLIERIDDTLVEHQPDIVIVQGDTTTVFCAALASFYRRIPVAQVEAGLRTGTIASPFPEEANRRITTPLVQWHYAPTSRAREALLAEGIDGESILVTGNTVIDALLMELSRQRTVAVQQAIDSNLNPLLGGNWRNRDIVLVTGHRRENFGQGFEQICNALQRIAAAFPRLLIVYPVHLNPNVRATVHRQLAKSPGILLCDPLPYPEFVSLASACRLILTDSGGVQEEAPTLGKPVLVMRESTERREGVDAGIVKLVGANADRIVAETSRLLTDDIAYQEIAKVANPYGDGQASRCIVEHLAMVYR
jgi:UDP-N-acetylglucosamine 2-epimerase (non-hydrolysing)